MSAIASSSPSVPMFPRPVTGFAPVHVPRPAAQNVAESLEVKSCQRRAWELLDDVIRSQVCAFLSDDGRGQKSGNAKCVRYRATGSLPERFVTDIRYGGAGLRCAFPGLVRTVVRVSTTMRGMAVELVSEGAHTGAFYDLLCPTGRHVCFSELHDLILHRGVLVEDAVAVDVRSVIRQLAGLRTTQ
jgi:hypothetical protein